MGCYKEDVRNNRNCGTGNVSRDEQQIRGPAAMPTPITTVTIKTMHHSNVMLSVSSETFQNNLLAFVATELEK